MSTKSKPSALDELLHGIFTTALEGGIGYWSGCSAYHWMNEDGSDDTKGFYAVIRETEDEEGNTHRINRSVVSAGYRLATTTFRDRLNWSTDKPPLVVGPDTDWDYDAGDADMIVQLGLFGEVVYG